MVQKPYTLIIVFVLITLIFFNAYGEDNMDSEHKIKTRAASVAGAFYPGKKDELKKTVDNLLKNSDKTDSAGKIYAAVAPHAGYIYSGQTAALTFKNISDIDFDTIVIIGHDTFQDAVAYTCPVDFFETPLGKIPVDREMMERLEGFNKGIRSDISIHMDDHTIEVQLPFLQAMNKNCKILPIMFGFPSPENCRILADAIKRAAGDKKVFVLASSDMSHYPTYEGSNEIDNLTLDKIRSMEIDLFFRHVYSQMKKPQVPGLQTAICASGGVGTAILFAKEMGADTALVLKHTNSGDVAGGDKTRVVGYSSLLFIKK